MLCIYNFMVSLSDIISSKNPQHFLPQKNGLEKKTKQPAHFNRMPDIRFFLPLHQPLFMLPSTRSLPFEQEEIPVL
jgi:hypothetical protein